MRYLLSLHCIQRILTIIVNTCKIAALFIRFGLIGFRCQCEDFIIKSMYFQIKIGQTTEKKIHWLFKVDFVDCEKLISQFIVKKTTIKRLKRLEQQQIKNIAIKLSGGRSSESMRNTCLLSDFFFFF